LKEGLKDKIDVFTTREVFEILRGKVVWNKNLLSWGWKKLQHTTFYKTSEFYSKSHMEQTPLAKAKA
jgi:hypothetical protein